MLREVKGIARVSTTKLLQLYTILVRTNMDYGAILWQGSKHINRLAPVQRKALCLCLGLPTTAATDVVKVAAGIPPIDLHLTDISTKELAKIQSKPITRPIKTLLSNITETDSTNNMTRMLISPIRLALTQAKEMEKNTGIEIRMIEPELQL